MKLEFGDLVFYMGTGLFSKAVEGVTDSQYSHVAFVVDNVHLLDVNILQKLKFRHFEYNDKKFHVYRFPGLTDEEKQKMLDFIYMMLNTRYDYIQDVYHVLNRLFGTKILNDGKRFNCSEAIDKIFLYGGKDFITTELEGSVTPEDLVRSGKIIRIY